MPKTTMAPAGAATFIVPRIRLRDGSVGCIQIAGSSGSFASATVPYSASISNAFDNGDGAGGGFVESSSSGDRSRRHPRAAVDKTTARITALNGRGRDLVITFGTSEPQLQSQLDNARTAAGSRDLAEAGAADVPIRISERRCVRHV